MCCTFWKKAQHPSIADLSGLTIQATGQGAIPEYVLNELLANGGLSKPATVEYRSQHSELASLTAAGKADLVMLPEPFVTTVLSKTVDMRVALDLTEEWSKMMTATGRAGEMSMGCFVVSEAFFAAEHPEALEDFLSSIRLPSTLSIRIRWKPERLSPIFLLWLTPSWPPGYS